MLKRYLEINKHKSKLPIFMAMALVISSVLLTSCGNENGAREITRLTGPVPLVDKYSSLMTIEQVRSQLGITQIELEQVLKPELGSKQRTSESSLTYRWFEIERKNVLLGDSGRVSFEFYQNRLARIVFFPNDVGEFLAKTFNVKVKLGESGVVQTTTPSLRIAFGSRHVVWMDERIMTVVSNVD